MPKYFNKEGIGKCHPDTIDDKSFVRGWNAAVDYIKNMPDADVVEHRRGEWMNGDLITYYLDGEKYAMAYCFRCSECGKIGRRENYCPNCGADMWSENKYE